MHITSHPLLLYSGSRTYRRTGFQRRAKDDLSPGLWTHTTTVPVLVRTVRSNMHYLLEYFQQQCGQGRLPMNVLKSRGTTSFSVRLCLRVYYHYVYQYANGYSIPRYSAVYHEVRLFHGPSLLSTPNGAWGVYNVLGGNGKGTGPMKRQISQQPSSESLHPRHFPSICRVPIQYYPYSVPFNPYPYLILA